MLAKFPDRRFRVTIVSISDRMPLVGARNRLKRLRMNPRIVIAGKTSNRFHDQTI